MDFNLEIMEKTNGVVTKLHHINNQWTKNKMFQNEVISTTCAIAWSYYWLWGSCMWQECLSFELGNCFNKNAYGRLLILISYIRLPA